MNQPLQVRGTRRVTLNTPLLIQNRREAGGGSLLSRPLEPAGMVVLRFPATNLLKYNNLLLHLIAHLEGAKGAVGVDAHLEVLVFDYHVDCDLSGGCHFFTALFLLCLLKTARPLLVNEKSFDTRATRLAFLLSSLGTWWSSSSPLFCFPEKVSTW